MIILLLVAITYHPLVVSSPALEALECCLCCMRSYAVQCLERHSRARLTGFVHLMLALTSRRHQDDTHLPNVCSIV
jgi:hypothetical protein